MRAVRSIILAIALAALIPLAPAAARSTAALSVSIHMQISGTSHVDTTVAAPFVYKDTGCFAGYDKSNRSTAYGVAYHAKAVSATTQKVAMIIVIQPYRSSVSSYSSSKVLTFLALAGRMTYYAGASMHATPRMSLHLGPGGRSGSFTATHVPGVNVKTHKTGYANVLVQWSCSGISKP